MRARVPQGKIGSMLLVLTSLLTGETEGLDDLLTPILDYMPEGSTMLELATFIRRHATAAFGLNLVDDSTTEVLDLLMR